VWLVTGIQLRRERERERERDRKERKMLEDPAKDGIINVESGSGRLNGALLSIK
jgi:hypothetical protein